MNELAAAGAAVTGLKTAFDLTKTFLDVQGAVKIQAKVIELQGHILSAQESAMTARDAQASLISRIADLEAEVARLKKWETDKQDYRLLDAGSGAFVYMPKAEPTKASPNHWLCVKCFEGGQRSVLQNQGRTKNDQQAIHGCPSCKSTVLVHWRRGPHNRGEPLADGTVQED